MIQLSDEQFKSAAMLGLGRAVLFAQQEGHVPNEEAVMHIMLHNTAYDAQIEGTRSWYAVQLLKCAGDTEEYQRTLRAEIERTPPSDDRDECHRLAIVRRFADDGNSAMRSLLYDRTAANIAAGFNPGIDEVIALDGSAGIDFVIEHFTKTGHSLADLRYDIESGIADRPELESLPVVKQIRKIYEAERASQKSTRPQIHSFVDYRKLVESNPKKLRMYPGRWAKNASNDELQNAAAELLTISLSDHDRLLAYLSIFAYGIFPLDPTPLIDMARKYDGSPIRTEEGKIIPSQAVPFRAFIALAKVNHPKVRAFALESIEQGANLERAVDLLENNYQPGDWSLIWEVVQRPHSTEVLHDIGMTVSDIAKKYPSQEAFTSLNDLIERGPCAHCRYGLLKRAYDLGSLPELVKAESLLDSYDDTREWAASIAI